MYILYNIQKSLKGVYENNTIRKPNGMLLIQLECENFQWFSNFRLVNVIAYYNTSKRFYLKLCS